jgi:hypothetical protein
MQVRFVLPGFPVQSVEEANESRFLKHEIYGLISLGVISKVIKVSSSK